MWTRAMGKEWAPLQDALWAFPMAVHDALKLLQPAEGPQGGVGNAHEAKLAIDAAKKELLLQKETTSTWKFRVEQNRIRLDDEQQENVRLPCMPGRAALRSERPTLPRSRRRTLLSPAILLLHGVSWSTAVKTAYTPHARHGRPD